MTAVLVLIVIALWVGAFVRLSTARTAPSRAFGRSVLALAIAGTVYLPAVAAAITALTIPGIASVALYVSAAVAAIEMLQFMLWTTDPARARRMTGRRRVGAIVGIGAALTLAVLLGRPETSNLADPWAVPAWQYVFWLFWLVFVCVTTGRMLAVCIRYIRHAGPSPLRTSQILLAGAATSGLVYSAARIACLFDPERSQFELLAALSVLFLLGFLAAASMWAIVVTLPLARARTDWHALQRIRPLWELLEPVNPATALNPLPTTRPASSQEVRFALCRAVVEIRDWMYSLAPYVDAGTWDTCLRDAAEQQSNDHSARVGATAMWLSIALDARDAGRTPHSGAICPPASDDIDADIRLLSDVARTMSSPTGAAIDGKVAAQ